MLPIPIRDYGGQRFLRILLFPKAIKFEADESCNVVCKPRNGGDVLRNQKVCGHVTKQVGTVQISFSFTVAPSLVVDSSKSELESLPTAVDLNCFRIPNEIHSCAILLKYQPWR